MTKSIEITQRDDDKTDYLKLIVRLLNERFTSKESAESRWQLDCLEIAQKLGVRIIVEKDYVAFDFTT